MKGAPKKSQETKDNRPEIDVRKGDEIMVDSSIDKNPMANRQQEDDSVSEPNNDPVESLASLLAHACIDGNNIGSIPDHTLERIMTKKRIQKSLAESLPGLEVHVLGDLLGKLCQHTQLSHVERAHIDSHKPTHSRLYAILVLLGNEAEIQSFINAGVSDEDLPLSRSEIERVRDQAGKEDINLPPTPRRLWTEKGLERFEQEQQQKSVKSVFSQQNESPQVRRDQLESTELSRLQVGSFHIPYYNETSTLLFSV